ncbi:MAG: hypothetical protein FWH37_01085 [Candidatus Bathyarchaeota archaeon]|nr:hypothetical protein [Candidatus Termiticorpusculum sp.]
MDFGTKKTPPSNSDVATKTITTLRMQQYKMEQTCSRLKQRDNNLFATCKRAINDGNREKAAIYAAEVVEVRRLGQVVYQIQLNIEGVILRLETLRELSDLVFDLRPALKLLQNASTDLFKVLPDVSAELTNVSNTIQETLHITKMSNGETLIPVGTKTEGGEEIIKEVATLLEQKINQNLPEPPASVPNNTIKTLTAPVRERVALAASCSERFDADEAETSEFDVSKTLISFKKSEVKEITMEVKQPVNKHHFEEPVSKQETVVTKQCVVSEAVVSKQCTLEETVLLEYLRKCDGQLDVSKCSKELETTDKEIELTLKNLGTKGKIKLELNQPD